MNKKLFYLLLSIFYTLFGSFFSLKAKTTHWFLFGIIIGVITVFFLLKKDRIKNLIKIRNKNNFTKELKKLEEENKSIIDNNVKIKNPVGKKELNFKIPSKFTILYFLIGIIILVLDKGNGFFSFFIGLVTPLLWFEFCFFRWKS